jgi:hypothetical protein
MFGITENEAELLASEKKEKDIQELYTRLKDLVKIEVKKIKFGKYAGSKSYKIIIDDENSME